MEYILLSVYIYIYIYMYISRDMAVSRDEFTIQDVSF